MFTDCCDHCSIPSSHVAHFCFRTLVDCVVDYRKCIDKVDGLKDKYEYVLKAIGEHFETASESVKNECAKYIKNGKEMLVFFTLALISQLLLCHTK